MNRGPSPEPRQGFRQHAEFRFGAIGAWCLELLQSVEPGTWCLVILLTCFAAPSARSAATLTTLYSFNGPEGANPVGGLVLGADGSFYGTTGYGGTGFTGRSETGKGTVFKIARDGTVTNLHLFGGGDDGVWPLAGLVQGSDGNLYGTTTAGGLINWGTMFAITPSGEFVALTSFGAGAPASVLVPGRDGNFYSMADFGGEYGRGTLFRVTPGGNITVLVSFDGTNGSTGFFADALVQGADGNFYGTTQLGGPTFESEFLNPAYGAKPYYATLVQDSDGNFYGTTYRGGASYNRTNAGFGTVFRLSVTASPPAFQSITRNGSTIAFTWSAVAGRAYQVQFKTNLTQSTWTDLGSAILGTNTTATASDSIGTNRQRFYRVVLLP